MQTLIVVVAGSGVMAIALLVVWRLTMRASRAGNLDNIFVSRDWLIHHRENDRS
jgi:hypothetical protein